MNKNLIACGAASLMAATGTFAQELSVTTTFAWESAYIFRGVQLAEETYMPSIDFAYGGAYFGIWTAQPVDDDDGNEVDFYAGYGWEAADGISLDVGITNYTYPDSGADDDTFEAFIGAAFDTVLSPSIYVYNDFDLDTITVELSGGHSIPMDDKISFDMSGAIGYVSPDEGDSYSYAVASAGIGYAFNDYVSGSIYANYSFASEDMMFDGGSDEFWFGFSVTGGF